MKNNKGLRKISPKELNMDNPLQAGGAARGAADISLPATPNGVELLRSSGRENALSTPSCASLAEGYPYPTPYGVSPQSTKPSRAKYKVFLNTKYTKNANSYKMYIVDNSTDNRSPFYSRN
jgi:hypothetical protein